MGAFHPEPNDDVPACADGRAARTLVLAGNVGTTMWQAFSKAGITGTEGLDQWSRECMSQLATELEATPIFVTQGPPYVPLQQWVVRSGPYEPSPIRILIHPDYGLWHAFRGALAFANRLDLQPRDMRSSPCENCNDRPCLSTCPVDAFDGKGYNVAACTSHLDTPEGSDCLDQGCRARRACPVGSDFIYEPAQAHHHMAAFLRVNRVQ